MSKKHRKSLILALIMCLFTALSMLFPQFMVYAEEYVETYQPEVFEIPYLIYNSDAAIVFNTLTRNGFSKEASFGILADLLNISPTLDYHYSDGNTVSIVRANLDDLNAFAAQYGESWPEIRLQTQIEYLIYQFNCGIWDNDVPEYYIEEYTQDYVCVPFDDFKNLTDIKQALVCFRACYTFEDFVTAEEANVIASNVDQYLGYVATLTGTSSVLTYVDYAVRFALDNSHGYNNTPGYNVGNPDFDCGGFVSSTLWHTGILPSNALYEPNDGIQFGLLYYGFDCIPFTSVYDLKTGDVLYKYGHTEMYVGAGLMAGAHTDEGGYVPGDQTGSEVDIYGFYDKGWEYVFRYKY